jgi:dihydrofolate reductase
MEENLARAIATQETVLLGRRTYYDWAGLWPTSDIEPFASFINSVEKFVVTSTTPERTWATNVRSGAFLLPGNRYVEPSCG